MTPSQLLKRAIDPVPLGALRNDGVSSSDCNRALYCFHAANASSNARSPGVPFSIARMARRLLL